MESGVCEMGSGTGCGDEAMVIADIPGLIEGAHRGVGLGRGFLRHVERCKMIIHIVNLESENPVGDFESINRELQLFSQELANKPQIVVLNKIDIDGAAERLPELTRRIKAVMPHTRLLTISAAGRIGLDELKARSFAFLKKLKIDEEKAQLLKEEAESIVGSSDGIQQPS